MMSKPPIWPLWIRKRRSIVIKFSIALFSIVNTINDVELGKLQIPSPTPYHHKFCGILQQFSITYYVYFVFDIMKKRKCLWSYALTWLRACSPYIDNGIMWCNIWCISFFSKGGFYGSKVSSSSISKVELHCRWGKLSYEQRAVSGEQWAITHEQWAVTYEQ
jgi:hypothetical protein